MKVVLFCGGLGMRMRADNQSLPKPMMPIGEPAGAVARDALLRLLRAHRVRALPRARRAGGQGLLPELPGDRVQRLRAHQGRLATSRCSAPTSATGRSRFIDTGMDTAIGERLRRVRPLPGGRRLFLANYGDVLTDAPMDELVAQFEQTDAVAQMLAVKPQDSFHVVDVDDDGQVAGLVPVADMSLCINGGYFVLRQGIFDYLEEGDDLVMDGCVRAARRRPGARGALRRLLGADGHAQGAHRPGGAVPPRHQPLGAVARPPGAARRPRSPRSPSTRPELRATRPERSRESGLELVDRHRPPPGARRRGWPSRHGPTWLSTRPVRSPRSASFDHDGRLVGSPAARPSTMLSV